MVLTNEYGEEGQIKLLTMKVLGEGRCSRSLELIGLSYGEMVSDKMGANEALSPACVGCNALPSELNRFWITR